MGNTRPRTDIGVTNWGHGRSGKVCLWRPRRLASTNRDGGFPLDRPLAHTQALNKITGVHSGLYVEPNLPASRPCTPGLTAKRPPSHGAAFRCSADIVKRAEVT